MKYIGVCFKLAITVFTCCIDNRRFRKNLNSPTLSKAIGYFVRVSNKLRAIISASIGVIAQYSSDNYFPFDKYIRVTDALQRCYVVPKRYHFTLHRETAIED